MRTLLRRTFWTGAAAALAVAGYLAAGGTLRGLAGVAGSAGVLVSVLLGLFSSLEDRP